MRILSSPAFHDSLPSIRVALGVTNLDRVEGVSYSAVFSNKKKVSGCSGLSNGAC